MAVNTQPLGAIHKGVTGFSFSAYKGQLQFSSAIFCLTRTQAQSHQIFLFFSRGTQYPSVYNSIYVKSLTPVRLFATP